MFCFNLYKIVNKKLSYKKYVFKNKYWSNNENPEMLRLVAYHLKPKKCVKMLLKSCHS